MAASQLELSKVSLNGQKRKEESNMSEFDLNQLLEQFQTPSNIPKTTRVDSKVQQQSRQPISLLDSWKYIHFVTSQATHIAYAFVHHHVYGPAKPSWGIEMTLFTTFLRQSVNYTNLSSIELLRQFLNLGQILPTPKDGIVTPISFRVKRRRLTGFLAHADSQEDGTREITGEWVINRKLWKRMQEQYKGSPKLKSPDVEENMGTSASTEQVIYYLHGGAYYVMSAASHRFLTVQLSKYTNSRIFAINYRLAPETQFPGALLDAVAGYFRLIHDLKIPSENIVVVGDSAGGGLSMALLLYLRDEGYPLPSGAVLMSPWVDLTMSCASWDTNAEFDYLPQPADNDHLHPVKCFFRPDEIREYITHPYASPLFGDLHGLPPLLIQCGDAERLRDEGTLLAHKACLAGVQVEHEIYEDCVHVFQMFGFLEATTKALGSIRQFFKSLPSRHSMDNTHMDSQIMADAHTVDSENKLNPESLPSTTTTTMPTSVEEERDGQHPSPEAIEEDQTPASHAAMTATRLMIDTASALSYDKTEKKSPASARLKSSESKDSDRDSMGDLPEIPKSPSKGVLRRSSLANLNVHFATNQGATQPRSASFAQSRRSVSAKSRNHSRAQTTLPPPAPSSHFASLKLNPFSSYNSSAPNSKDDSLRVRPRANSHPNILALMNEYAKSEGQDEYDSGGEEQPNEEPTSTPIIESPQIMGVGSPQLRFDDPFQHDPVQSINFRKNSISTFNTNLKHKKSGTLKPSSRLAAIQDHEE